MYTGGSKDDTFRRVEGMEPRAKQPLRVQSVMIRPGDVEMYNMNQFQPFERSPSFESTKPPIKTLKLRLEYKGHSLPIDPNCENTVC